MFAQFRAVLALFAPMGGHNASYRSKSGLIDTNGPQWNGSIDGQIRPDHNHFLSIECRCKP
jgi:hypothetical protein